MSHNLETRNGKTSFVSARVPAWHQLGTVLPSSLTAAEALEHGGLAGWNLRKAPIRALDEETGELVPVSGSYGILRDRGDGTSDTLGVVGELYKIMQNEQLTGLMDALVDESGAHYETAGAVSGGKKVFVSMKLPNHISVGGVDPIENYLTAMTSHDGSTSTIVMVTPVRVVCQNTMSLALKSHRSSFRVRHTSSADRVVLNQARHLLDMSFKYLDDFSETAERLVNERMTESTFEKIIEAEFGVDADAPVATRTRSQNKMDEMLRLFADSNTHAEVRNTKWAGLNALTEWFDHYSPVRGNGERDEVARARKTLFDTEFKPRALELIDA